MQTTKKWEKVEDTVFSFSDNDQHIGTLKIARGSEGKAIASFQDNEFELKKTGFWKSNLEIRAKNGQLIAKTYAEKWYKRSSILEYDYKKYTLRVRNNPLAEWAIQENGHDILSYGLTTQNGKPSIKISTTAAEPNYVFDFILWYLFLPTAAQQSADDLTFLLLVS